MVFFIVLVIIGEVNCWKCWVNFSFSWCRVGMDLFGVDCSILLMKCSMLVLLVRLCMMVLLIVCLM